MLRSLLALAAAAPAWGSTLTVAPGWIEVEAPPGQTTTEVIQLSVDGGMYAFEAVVWDWWYAPEGGSVFSPPGTQPRSAAAFVSVPETAVWADPERPGRLAVDITPPPFASGGYYAVVFVQEVVDAPDGEGLRTVSRVAVPLLIGVGGARSAEVSVADVVPPGRAGALEVHLDVRNDGDRHVRPAFRGVLRGEAGEVITFGDADDRFLLPGQARRMVVAWDGELAPGAWRLDGILQLGGTAVVPVTTTFEVDEYADDAVSAAIQ